jgi:VWFA-related protein
MRCILTLILLSQLLTVGWSQEPVRPPAAPSSTPERTAQQPDDDDVVKITTNLVQVDAVITDDKGNPVTDLKPEEIEIFEDGRKQKVTNLSFTSLRSSDNQPVPKKTVEKDVPGPTRLKREEVRRTIAIIVDDLGLSFESIAYTRRALRQFVDQQMQPGDLVAIIRTSGGIGALQQFTADKRQLYAAIDRVKWYSRGRAGIGVFQPIRESAPDGEKQAPLRNPNSTRNPEIDNHPNDETTWVPGEDATKFRDDILSVGTLGALSYVVQGLTELPGRKSVLLISDGFSLYDPKDPSRARRLLDAVRRLTDQANRSSVVISTMDARGLQPLGLTAEDSLTGVKGNQIGQLISQRRYDFNSLQEGLNLLAQETGGIAILNNNDLSGGIRRVLQDQSGYYLIGYRPNESTFDLHNGRRQFHKLSLKVLRPGKFKVRMRPGFFGVPDEVVKKSATTPTQQMANALISPFGETGVQVQLTSLFFANTEEGPSMRSLLHINGSDLTFTEGADHQFKTVVDILALTFGDNGIVLDAPVSRTFTILLSPELHRRALRDGLVYYLSVPIKKPGAYQLRIALRDSASRRIGSASQFVEVPDLKKDRIALSGIVVRGETASAKAKTGEAQLQAASALNLSEAVEKENAAASPAVRRFRAGMTLEYLFFIFNARLDKVTNQPRLTTQLRMFRDGKIVYVGNETIVSQNQTIQSRFQREAVSKFALWRPAIMCCK